MNKSRHIYRLFQECWRIWNALPNSKSKRKITPMMMKMMILILSSAASSQEMWKGLLDAKWKPWEFTKREPCILPVRHKSNGKVPNIFPFWEALDRTFVVEILMTWIGIIWIDPNKLPFAPDGVKIY
mmetsp:Transcript_15483/g.44490  ORF Transcript_15483/g.44490 Transcript_15483/m.44490 type:complete len:127 (-) Transcript_15483:387-767(-)